MGRTAKISFVVALCGLLAACESVRGALDSLGRGIDSLGEGIGSGVNSLGDETAKPGEASTPKLIVALEKILAVPTPDRDRKAVELIESAPHATNPELTRYLVARADQLPPLLLYELAGRTYPFDRWKGVSWYYAARVRLLYDLTRCTDPSTMAELSDADGLVSGPLVQIRLEPRIAYATALAGLEWEASHPIHTITPLPACLSGGDAVRAFGRVALVGKTDKYGMTTIVGPDGIVVNPADWVRPMAGNAALLKAARERVRAEINLLADKAGGLPPEWAD